MSARNADTKNGTRIGSAARIPAKGDHDTRGRDQEASPGDPLEILSHVPHLLTVETEHNMLCAGDLDRKGAGDRHGPMSRGTQPHRI